MGWEVSPGHQTSPCRHCWWYSHSDCQATLLYRHSSDWSRLSQLLRANLPFWLRFSSGFPRPPPLWTRRYGERLRWKSSAEASAAGVEHVRVASGAGGKVHVGLRVSGVAQDARFGYMLINMLAVKLTGGMPGFSGRLRVCMKIY